MGKSGADLGVVAGLVRASFLVNAVYAESAREYGLTVQQGQLLCVLMGRPYGMGDLGATLGLEKSSLTGLVDRAVRRGLVRRAPDPDDRRAVHVLLTPEGRELAEDFYAATCRRVDDLAARLSPPERDRLGALLGTIVHENEAPTVFLDTLQP
ncbi:MarR family transcriptional regulator [Amycolatopsis sp. NPDC049688]|uniref:MarR family winged helix-turn-helix transcriptional regulator n=1 Tax=Amycolatopsis sp. NPDC049688 TaxID=3154733 RepID=UPI003448D7A7